jgi:predicted alpha/beta hydrolase
LTGDFNGDGKTDVSLVNQSAGWSTLPVAFSQGNGNFSVTNQFIGDFASWSANSNVRVLTGDFNGDGKTDVSLVNQSAGWNTLPVAFSQGNGNFSVTNQFIGDFASWSANSNVRVLTGDFNGDGKTDVSLVNKSVGWNTLPVAFSQGNGNFSVTNQFTGDFASWAANPNVDALTGDFNGDGKTDVALINKTAGWNTLPVAFSQGNGSFSVTNQFIGDFASWAANPNVRVRTGDFNGDGKTDVSLVNQSAGWNTLPVAFSQGNGNFSVTNQFIGDFASWAANPNVNVLTGNFNGDSKTDVALVNQSAGWNTLPVAFF